MPQQDQRKMDLARRLLRHYQAGTTDSAPDVMAMPVDAYLDPDRYRAEVDQVFKRHPLALALSIEFPEPGSWRAMTVLDVPVLMVRGKDMRVRAFINTCRHRGAPVCENGHGLARSRKFSCPYHAWVYDDRGRLTGMFGASTFGDVDRADLGLTELSCDEVSGLIWVTLTPGLRPDIRQWLHGFDKEVDTLDLGNWYLYDQRAFEGPGWKVTWDGYLEGYHQEAVHPETVGKNTIANLMAHDTYGPHQRFVFGRKNLGQLADIPEDEWVPDDHIRLIHSGFPNLSLSGVIGGFCLASMVFPGKDLEHTVTIQNVLVHKKPETEAEIEAAEVFSRMGLIAVRDEDYDLGFKIQAGLASKGNQAFLFGRNEPTLQHFHKWIAKLCEEAKAEAA
ncbi:MAG: Rieske 2Fe-2S domain-containing protein [Alphaproteobacteria bacterium]|nr:Rieske 2Fe-2S domain-containing protein [Alphaproteobacteria bacterium]